MGEIIGKMSIDVFGNLENRISELELEKDIKIKKEIYTGECEYDLCFYKGIDAEIKKKDKIIDLMAEEISSSIVRTCPYEDYDFEIDCKNRCSNDNNLIKECWKIYFKEKVDGRRRKSDI